MSKKQPRIAILLRGPQLSGKTTIGRQLAGKPPISLDDGNYDLLRANDELLLIELGYGESLDNSTESKGPTRNPGEWQKVLQDEGRVLFAFYLTADRLERNKRAMNPDAIHRNVDQRTLDGSDHVHQLPEMLQFAQKAKIQEHQIDTIHKSKEAVAEEIRAVVMKDYPDLCWPTAPK